MTNGATELSLSPANGMTSIEDVQMKRAFDAFENAATATDRVVEVADKWADRLCGTGSDVPLSRLSPNLSPEDSKQFGMLRRVAAFVDAVKTTAGYEAGTTKIVSAYERLLKVIEVICGQRQMPVADADAVAKLNGCCARLRGEFRRKGCSAGSVGIIIEDFISSFEPICAAVRRCEDTILLPGGQAANSAKAAAEAVVPSVFARLYDEMCFSHLGNDDSKLRMGLSALAEYVRECISKKETRLFGCPMFIRTVYEIDQTKVASIRIAESEEAEGLWTDFKGKLVLALGVLQKRGLVGTAALKSWLQDCGDITGQAGSYRSYRRIRHEALDGLLSQCRDMAACNHADCEEAVQMLFCGIFDGIEAMPAFLPMSVHAAVHGGEVAERAVSSPSRSERNGHSSGEDALPRSLLAEIAKTRESADRAAEMAELSAIRANTVIARQEAHNERGTYGKTIGDEERQKAVDIWETGLKAVRRANAASKNVPSFEDVFNMPLYRARLELLGIDTVDKFRNAVQTHRKNEKNRKARTDGKNPCQGDA